MCSPNESVSQASTPINSQSVSENRSQTHTHARTRTPILATLTLSGVTCRLKRLAGEASCSRAPVWKRSIALKSATKAQRRSRSPGQVSAEAPLKPSRAATSAPCLTEQTYHSRAIPRGRKGCEFEYCSFCGATNTVGNYPESNPTQGDAGAFQKRCAAAAAAAWVLCTVPFND